MKITTCFRKRQQGAVAIIVGLSLFILIGLLGLVLDLGHLYIAKTELQNAADAAALSGAKELNGTAAGVTSAVNNAILTAGQNKFDFTQQVVIDIGDVSVGNCPEDSCMQPASSITSNTLAANKTFLKVLIPSENIRTWFMRAIPNGTQNTATYGLAVAGKYTVEITPMAVCAVDPTRPEDGFLRGVAYNLPDLNPINNGDPIWINPVDAYPGACDPNHGNTGTMTPFVCTGNSTTITSIPGDVWVNTGAQAVMNGPLNSRFGDNYSGGQACDPTTAPADVNVKEFLCTQASNPNRDNYCSTSPGVNAPETWIDETNATPRIPYHQTIETQGSPKQGKPFNYPTRTTPETVADFSKYGVLWSYSKEISNFNTTPYTEYGTSNWPILYGGTAENFPATSPYLTYIQPPTGAGAVYQREDRRVLNLAIIDCAGVTSIPGQQCQMHLPVIAIGKFFMQRRAELPNNVTGEFAGIFAPPFPPADIRLYR